VGQIAETLVYMKTLQKVTHKVYSEAH